MRGCTRGCRFCHAGTWYRPVRERKVDDVVRAGLEQLGCTGYDELSLTSLATSDYTGVERAIGEIKRERPSLHLSLPSNRVDTGPVAMNAAANARQGSITLAPEAATQRMRDIICKTITDEMIERAIEAAFAAGYTSLKMYFMIGLPRETFAEVQGIVDLAYRAREIGRRQLGHGGRFTVHVSASNFVPKPHTPFQWEGMSSPDQLRVKQEYLRRAITRPPAAAVAARHRHVPARGRARSRRRGDGRRDRDGMARRRALRRLDRASPAGGLARGVRGARAVDRRGGDARARRRSSRCRGITSGAA